MVRALVLAASVIKRIVCGDEALSAFGWLMLGFLVFKRQPILWKEKYVWLWHTQIRQSLLTFINGDLLQQCCMLQLRFHTYPRVDNCFRSLINSTSCSHFRLAVFFFIVVTLFTLSLGIEYNFVLYFFFLQMSCVPPHTAGLLEVDRGSPAYNGGQ